MIEWTLYVLNWYRAIFRTIYNGSLSWMFVSLIFDRQVLVSEFSRFFKMIMWIISDTFV